MSTLKATRFTPVGDQRSDHEVLDFRVQMWGHAIHAGTFMDVTKTTRIQKLLRRKIMPEYSVMVHCFVNPRVGDSIVYKSADGETWGTVTLVEPCGNPDDMFTLQFRKMTIRPITSRGKK